MRTALIGAKEPTVRTSLKNRLMELGFDEIMECGDGEASVATALARLPDIALLDVALTKIDGLTVASKIRNKLAIPIILLAGHCDTDTVKKARAGGIAAILSKPIRSEELWPAIELAFAHAEEVESLKGQVEELKETIESRKLIEKAKGVLMRTRGLTEQEAFRMMQKLAMDKRKSMRQIAEAILMMEG